MITDIDYILKSLNDYKKLFEKFFQINMTR